MTSIQSVSGPAVTESIRCADAHGHLWISKGVEQAPALDDERASLSELSSFAEAGGGLILDCQPGICGRDGSVLARLAASTTVTIVASTGFHLQKYYVGGTGPWSQSAEEAERVFRDELCHGLSEAPGVKAGSIKTAWGGTGGREDELLLAALDVAMSVGVGMTVHTEMGVGVERLATLIVDSGVAPNRVQLSHVDKRPDIGLHADRAYRLRVGIRYIPTPEVRTRDQRLAADTRDAGARTGEKYRDRVGHCRWLHVASRWRPRAENDPRHHRPAPPARGRERNGD